jgi:NAD(P)-dependent dehydrogenase (short-subunit alcohol dehydrogenase family)
MRRRTVTQGRAQGFQAKAGHDPSRRPVAIVTGASQGLGRVVAEALARRGWSLVIDARRADRLAAAARELESFARVVALPGDVTDPDHRAALVRAAEGLGPLKLLVNNASTLGASPLPRLDQLSSDVLRRTYEVNVVAPLALTQLSLPLLEQTPGATVVNITSDAAVEAYEGWGGYGSSKAALEHLSRVLAVERPRLRVLVVDPGDLRTEMHQAAFPGEDISDRPLPEEAVPGFIELIQDPNVTGRQRVRSTAVPAAQQAPV